eukprot:UN34038
MQNFFYYPNPSAMPNFPMPPFPMAQQEAPLCYYHQRGGCWFGENCQFSHSDTATAVPAAQQPQQIYNPFYPPPFFFPYPNMNQTPYMQMPPNNHNNNRNKFAGNNNNNDRGRPRRRNNRKRPIYNKDKHSRNKGPNKPWQNNNNNGGGDNHNDNRQSHNNSGNQQHHTSVQSTQQMNAGGNDSVEQTQIKSSSTTTNNNVAKPEDNIVTNQTTQPKTTEVQQQPTSKPEKIVDQQSASETVERVKPATNTSNKKLSFAAMVQKDPTKAPIAKPVSTILTTPIKKQQQQPCANKLDDFSADTKSNNPKPIENNSDKSNSRIAHSSSTSPQNKTSAKWPLYRPSSRQIRTTLNSSRQIHTTLNSLVGEVVEKSTQNSQSQDNEKKTQSTTISQSPQSSNSISPRRKIHKNNQFNNMKTNIDNNKPKVHQTNKHTIGHNNNQHNAPMSTTKHINSKSSNIIKDNNIAKKKIVQKPSHNNILQNSSWGSRAKTIPTTTNTEAVSTTKDIQHSTPMKNKINVNSNKNSTNQTLTNNIPLQNNN